MALRTIQQLLLIAYAVAPIVAIALSIFGLRRRRVRASSRRPMQIGGVAFTISASLVLGCAVSFAYAVMNSGHIALGQIALTSYFVAAMMFILRFFDAVLVWALRFAWMHGLSRIAPHDRPRARFALALIPGLARAAILILVGLPYLMGAALVYRPTVVPPTDPSSLKMRFEEARFDTSDGLTIAAWFMPGEDETLRAGQYQTSASPSSSSPPSSSLAAPEDLARRSSAAKRRQQRAQQREREEFQREQSLQSDQRNTDRTIILCHGFASGKAGAMRLARPLVLAGFNVLAIDFRGHGQSDGQLIALGATEKRDVLAAVRWLQEHHPRQAQTIFGLGVSSGAAALLAAAADDSADGRAIEAIAVYESYDSPAALTREFARQRFIPPLSWVADRIALAVASAHVGADLVHFSPAQDAAKLWPRPILVIHGGLDAVVPFERGEAVYEAAAEPKRRLWLSLDDYAAAVKSGEAIANVIEFFNEARAVPAI